MISQPHEAYIGILVNKNLYLKIQTGNTSYERLDFYEEEAATLGLKPCFLQLSDLIPGKPTAYALIKVADGIYHRTEIPCPLVIHNRAIYKNVQSNRKLDRLATSGIRLFNRRNRYGKLFIHELLMKDISIRPHLPETHPANLETIRYMQQQHDSLIIKPISGSIGRGIMKLSRMDNGVWELQYPLHQSFGWGIIRFRSTLPQALKKRIRNRSYLVQQGLPLASYKGRPFDLRVSVQRDCTGQWQITGIAGKIAKQGAFLTNVAQGGTVAPLSTILSAYPNLNPELVKLQIHNLSLRIAAHLSSELPDLADLGLDIGITEFGFPMFIECNGKDQRYSFQEGGMPELWRATYRNPMAYAHYLWSTIHT